jgi:hypothetical protein
MAAKHRELLILLAGFASCACASIAGVKVGDAFVQGSPDGRRWTIGTNAVRMVFESARGKFSLAGFANRLPRVPVEYVDAHRAAAPFVLGESIWTLESGAGARVAAGGRPAVQLDLTLRGGSLRLFLHLLAYPGTSIIRQWLDVENTGATPVPLNSAIFSMRLRSEDLPSFTHYWMTGATNKADHGMLQSANVAVSYHRALESDRSRHFVPWMSFERGSGERDGWFVALEYLGKWKLAVDHDATTPPVMYAGLPDLALRPLASGERRSLPTVTLGVFQRDLDDMAERVYDWQYEYLWDYTRDDWFALLPFSGSDFYHGGLNLQENFAGRLGWLDMGTADLIRSLGFDVLWDDAGWSEGPDVWKGGFEGPDFSQTQRYLAKMGMKWILWFRGRPPAGVLDTKVGAWGNFQWRTDAVGKFDLESDRNWREQLAGFRAGHPRSSFHTCDGGSSYGHTFDMQRYAEVNYFADAGRGDQTNYYLSYLELPDRWIDIVTAYNMGNLALNRKDTTFDAGKQDPSSVGELLSMVPGWLSPGPTATLMDAAYLRRVAEIYHYLLREGVAGRWSHVVHPVVSGDAERYYFQRISLDRTKAFLVVKHKSPGKVVIKPRGLLAGHTYTVNFESHQRGETRTGADLMNHGIPLQDAAARELIYLGMPKRPGGGTDRVAPSAPSRVLTRRETNIGHCGVGVYWSPGVDENWISYYQVRRNADLLSNVSTGTYYFDHAAGWDPDASYSVRTVDGDGNTSGWTAAQHLPNEPQTASALGAIPAPDAPGEWRAETTGDGRVFTSMNWVRPASSPFVDFSIDHKATVNQPGGLEGYWEGAGAARVGRGWQQASPLAASVRTWIAPRAGTIRIVGRAMKEYYRRNRGAPLLVSILRGDSRVWPQDQAGAPVGDLTGVTHDFPLAVSRGEAIRFVLDRGASAPDDLIAWMPRIIYADEPQKLSAASVVRLICGTTTPYTDSSGNQWSADRFYTGGTAVTTKAAIEAALPSAADQALYQAGRAGPDFTYKIPVRPGLYTIRLKFAEPRYEWSFERPMNLSINGRQVLRDFDICQSARGPRRAHERVFRYLVPDAEGRLVLRFAGGREPLRKSNQAMVQAIEVVPELKPPIRIDAGAESALVDWNSFSWSADAHFEGGRILRSSAPVREASPTLYDQALYQTARAGRAFRYQVPVPPGLYTVHLKFAELWLNQPGQRPMNVDVNGRRVRACWDPATAAGRLAMAADFREEDVAPGKDGHIQVRVTACGKEEAILQAIEIE